MGKVLKLTPSFEGTKIANFHEKRPIRIAAVSRKIIFGIFHYPEVTL